MTLGERVARNVKRQRLARGWSQRDLANRIGVHRVYITQIEGATRGVSLEVLEQLAKAFRVKASTLLD